MAAKLSAEPAAPEWHRFTAAEEGSGPAVSPGYGADVPTEDDLRLLGPVDGRRVLDLGCGVGRNAVALAERGAKLLAVDPSADHLSAAREQADLAEVRVEWHQADLADLAFIRSDSVDAALSAMALTEVDDLARVFRQVHRVLKPESPFVFSLPHPAFTMFDPGGDDPLRAIRAYDDEASVSWKLAGRSVTDHPRTISEVFTALQRTNFRVDHLLEPTAPARGARSPWFVPIMRYVPATVLFRARKQGN